MADSVSWNDLPIDEAARPKARKADWPLMGDILSHRAGVPEHLIQWRRAMGEEDPAPDQPVTRQR